MLLLQLSYGLHQQEFRCRKFQTITSFESQPPYSIKIWKWRKKRDETIFCLLCSFVFSCVLIQPAGAEHRAHCTFIRGGQLPVFQKASAENNAWAISLQQGPLVMKTAVKLAPRPCGRGKSFPCAEWKDHVAVMHSQAGPPYFPKQTTKEHL